MGCHRLLSFRTKVHHWLVFWNSGLLLICSLLEAWRESVYWLVSRSRATEMRPLLLADFQSTHVDTKSSWINKCLLVHNLGIWPKNILFLSWVWIKKLLILSSLFWSPLSQICRRDNKRLPRCLWRYGSQLVFPF